MSRDSSEGTAFGESRRACAAPQALLRLEVGAGVYRAAGGERWLPPSRRGPLLLRVGRSSARARGKSEHRVVCKEARLPPICPTGCQSKRGWGQAGAWRPRRNTWGWGAAGAAARSHAGAVSPRKKAGFGGGVGCQLRRRRLRAPAGRPGNVSKTVRSIQRSNEKRCPRSKASSSVAPTIHQRVVWHESIDQSIDRIPVTLDSMLCLCHASSNGAPPSPSPACVPRRGGLTLTKPTRRRDGSRLRIRIQVDRVAGVWLGIDDLSQ